MNIIDLHAPIWSRLSLRRSQLPHALMISGQSGIGKFLFARYFARSLLCESPKSHFDPCGDCAACGWLDEGNHPDFRLIQPDALVESDDDPSENTSGAASKKKASQQITIDQIRSLDDFLHVGTHRQGARVVLINPAEAMNRATANALLKSLEEPIPSTLFLLVTSAHDRLLPTIRSRCQSVPLPIPAHALSVQWMNDAGVSDAGQWLSLAGGAPLLAVELASSAERVLLDALVSELRRGRAIDALNAAATLDRVIKSEKRPAPLKRMIGWSQKWIFDLALCCCSQPAQYFVGQADILAKIARLADLASLLAFNRKALQYGAECEQPVNSRLFLEEFFMSYAELFRQASANHG